MQKALGFSRGLFAYINGKRDLNGAGMNDSPVGCQNRGDRARVERVRKSPVSRELCGDARGCRWKSGLEWSGNE